MKQKNFLSRAYTVMELRTGFATGLPVLSGGLFGAYLSGELNVLLLGLMFVAGFCFNIVANVANEIRAFLKNEENEDTFTHHLGSEGLVRGDAKFIDAVLVLGLMLVLGGGCGLLIVWITKSFAILAVGILSLLAAICYSLGPKPYIEFPVGEVVSGLFVGFVSTIISGYLQTNQFTLGLVLYAMISMIMTVFLMSTNNTSDYEKDKGFRVTLPHMIGFRNSIKLIIPEAIIMLVCFATLFLMKQITLLMFLSGLIIFYYYGYVRWYKDYYKIEAVYPQMGREFGPRPLLLINSFHVVMSLEFLIYLIGA